MDPKTLERMAKGMAKDGLTVGEPLTPEPSMDEFWVEFSKLFKHSITQYIECWYWLAYNRAKEDLKKEEDKRIELLKEQLGNKDNLLNIQVPEIRNRIIDECLRR